MPQFYKNSPHRLHIAQMAARLLMENPTLNHQYARRKAAEKLGITKRQDWPSIEEVMESLMQEQRLFCPNQPTALQHLRTQALAAMQHFQYFQPRLIGSVMEGTANYASCVYLYLFTDNAEDIILKLLDYNIPYTQGEKFLRYSDGSHLPHATFKFVAGDVDIELISLPLWAWRNPPLNPVNERPELGLDAKKLAQLIV